MAEARRSDALPAAVEGGDDTGLPSPARLAADLVRLFEQVAARPDKVAWVHRHVVDDLGADGDAALDPALERACATLAATIDADAVRFDRHAYHNRQHFCEVALTGHVLCLLAGRTVRATQLLLLAALVHDLVHDGTPAPSFVLERASVERVQGTLATAGVGEADRHRLAALVLATDPVHGNRFAAAACRWHAARGPGGHRGPAPVPPADAPELAALLADAGLADLARLLCEADLLPSIGLTLAHAMRLQAQLASEWRRPLDTHDKLAFIDGVLARGLVGPFFLANVRATRAALAEALHAQSVA